MNFHHQAICTDCLRGFGKRNGKVRATSRVRYIHHDGEVAFDLDHRHSTNVKRVARPCFVSTDTAFHQDHVGVAARHDVFCGVQPFFVGCAKATLEDDWLAHLAQRAEQVTVLHVACAHPEHVYIVRHHHDEGGV